MIRSGHVRPDRILSNGSDEGRTFGETEIERDKYVIVWHDRKLPGGQRSFLILKHIAKTDGLQKRSRL